MSDRGTTSTQLQSPTRPIGFLFALVLGISAVSLILFRSVPLFHAGRFVSR